MALRVVLIFPRINSVIFYEDYETLRELNWNSVQVINSFRLGGISLNTCNPPLILTKKINVKNTLVINFE